MQWKSNPFFRFLGTLLRPEGVEPWLHTCYLGTWTLQIVRPGLPARIATPSMTRDERDRLCIAWGLRAEHEWLNRQPSEIKDIVKQARDYSKAFISKDQV